MSSTVHLPPAYQTWVRTTLVALASIEAFIALLRSLQLIAPDVQIGNGHLFGQITTAAHLVVAPILGIVALLFAARNRLPQAIMALAAIVLTTWASDIISAQFAGVSLVLFDIVRPVAAVLAIVLAVHRTLLGFAAVLVASMWMAWAWVTFLSDFLPFMLGVMIYGA